ncbi:ribosome maturation factor RimM [Blochmannia endosymbiont of Camponotus nipponensis]|uniref:ribosome maturation factor RimM n=1 Tax=Blochmannia endosymbiont of Camponotus nipponensis TaxID=2681986 RepID=UPI00135BED09|nr:ribosome maturation factor RimM [Blochmannia endosymbiont of Camponotus nipponensis]
MKKQVNIKPDEKDVKVVPPLYPVVIGIIAGAYGILGWTRIISFTEQDDDIFQYNPYFVMFQSQWKLMYLDRWRLMGKRYIAKLQGISNRESAQLLNRCEMIVDETTFPCINDNEYYWKDLIGCTVITISGIVFGNIVNIIETTSNDILVVKMCQDDFYGMKDCLIPFIMERVIKNVNLVTHTVVVDWDLNF